MHMGTGSCSQVVFFLEAGADWLCVDSVHEAHQLRSAGITAPIYIMGYVSLEQIPYVVSLRCKIMVNNKETIEALAHHAAHDGCIIDIHLKVETGNNRQGIRPEHIVDFARFIQTFPSLRIEGLATHFSNIEDVKRHDFAEIQRQRFDRAYELLQEAGVVIPIRHCANAAATMMYPETHYDMVRPGVACYGIWPSPLFRETYLERHFAPITLMPAFTWKTKLAQIRIVPQGETIGYGRTFTTASDMRIGVVPVGYYDGYDRHLSNKGYVLVHDTVCPVVGRVSMNIIMIDLTAVPQAALEDEVILLGKGKTQSVDIEEIARLQDRIEYELPTRVTTNPIEEVPRILV